MKNTNQPNSPQELVISDAGNLAPIVKKLDKIAEDPEYEKLPILLIGEPGTGKELLAKRIHEHSARNNKAFDVINIASVPENLIESELFGHEKGSFTGAIKDQKGLIEKLDGGTLFLDELGALKPDFQNKLLRVIEYGDYRKSGGKESKKADVRFIAATNEQYDREGTYGEKGVIPKLKDRFIVKIHVPTLNGRGDIAKLLRHFLINSSFNAIEIEALWCMMMYNWPGNVRQLKDILINAGLERANEVLCGFHLPEEITEKFHDKFGILQVHTNFNEAIQEMHPAKVFHSKEAVAFWRNTNPKLVGDDTCMCLKLDDVRSNVLMKSRP